MYNFLDNKLTKSSSILLGEMFHQVVNHHRTNTDSYSIIKACALQIGKDKVIIKLIMETTVPREVLESFEEILAKSIPGLGINLGDEQSCLSKI